MVNRVTSQTLMMNAQRNLQSSSVQLARLQDQASSLKKISKPSDDPIGTADSLRIRSEQAATDQYGRNIDDGTGWLATVDSTLTNTTNLLRKVRDLTIQGANDGSMSPAAKEAIASELESLRDNLMNQANTKYLGRTIFAGNSDAGVAFQPDYSFTGSGSTVQRRLDANTTVRVDADGAAVFGTGANSAFALVDNIVADLRSGVNIGSHITQIDARMDAIVSEQSTVGARQAQILTAKDTNVTQAGALEAQRSTVEDLDLGKAVLDLKMQETVYQSTLAVTAKTLQPSLMDFLR